MPEDEIKISINDRMMKVIMENYSVYSDLYEIDCSSCEAVYFGESKRYLNSRSDKLNQFFYIRFIFKRYTTSWKN